MITDLALLASEHKHGHVQKLSKAPAVAVRRGAAAKMSAPTAGVKITPTDTGGVDLTLTTKVESMYGDATRQLVTEELKRTSGAQCQG